MIGRRLAGFVGQHPAAVRDAVIAVVLTLVALAAAGSFAARSRVMPAGDTFNFIIAAQALRHGTYQSDEKRLPLYPFLILLGEAVWPDPVVVARTISTVAFAGTFGALFLLGRRLGLAPLPLALLLFLPMVHPVLLGNGIRELADSLFVFLLVLANLAAIALRRSWPSVVITAGVFTATALTRYEGILAVFLLLPFLRLRVPWRTVGAVILLAAAFTTPWFVVATRAFGAPVNPAYFRCVEECGFGTRLPDLPARVHQLLDMSGWTKVWTVPARLIAPAEGEPVRRPLVQLAQSSSWWVSLWALLGIVWLLVSRPRAAFPVVLSLTVVAIMVAWWKLHGRFTVVALLLHYFAAGAGASWIWALVHFLLPRRPLRALGALLLTGALTLLAAREFPALHTGAVQRVFSYQGNGFARYQATAALARETGTVVFRRDYPMALAFLHSPYARGGLRGIFLGFDYPELPAADIVPKLREREPTWVLLDDSEDMTTLARALRGAGVVTEERTYRARTGLRGEGEETVTVLRLAWRGITGPAGR